MDLNMRVPPSSLVATAGTGDRIAGSFQSSIRTPFLEIFGAVDIAASSSQLYHGVDWFMEVGVTPLAVTDQIRIGELSAFAIEWVDTYTLAGTPDDLYDEGAEVRLGTPAQFIGAVDGINERAINAWVWPPILRRDFSIATVDPPQKLMIGYEGSPIVPFLDVRAGFGPGTDTALVLRHVFRLLAIPQVSFGATRISVPSPWCMPPFIAVGPDKGSHIFQSSGGFPSPQTIPFPRRFRTKPLTPTALEPTAPNVDARMLGGPWAPHVMGATTGGASTGIWDVQHLLSRNSIASYTPASIVSVGPAASASLHAPAGQLFDALRVTQTDAANSSTTDILLESNNE